MCPASTSVDSFPIPAGSAVHERIDALLQNCDALWPDATMGLLLPDCAGAPAPERSDLLAAAMERVEWHAVNARPDSEKRLVYRRALMRTVSGMSEKIDQNTLPRLARFGHRLHHNRGWRGLSQSRSVVLAGLKERKEPLAPKLENCRRFDVGLECGKTGER